MLDMEIFSNKWKDSLKMFLSNKKHMIFGLKTFKIKTKISNFNNNRPNKIHFKRFKKHM